MSKNNFKLVCYWEGDLNRNIYAVRNGDHVIAEFHDVAVYPGYNAGIEAQDFLERLKWDTAL